MNLFVIVWHPGTYARWPDARPEQLINAVGILYILITGNCIYISNQIAVCIVNRKDNLHIDLKNLILMNICLILLMVRLYFDEYEKKIQLINLKRNKKGIMIILFFTV